MLKKTKMMIFHYKVKEDNHELFYGTDEMETTDKYTYLRVQTLLY